MSRNYNQEFQDTNERKYAYDFDYIHRDYMIKAFTPFFTGCKALELGCYKGEFTKKILNIYDDVTVVEGSSELISIARKTTNNRAKFIESLFESVSLEEQYDAIFLIHTLEHLDNPEQVLNRIKRWLSKEGKLFLVVPNANAASRQIAVNMGLIEHNQAVTKGEEEHGHRATYSLDTLLAETKKAQLNVIQSGGILFKPLANFQFDQALNAKIIDDKYLEGCYQLGMRYPDLCASIYAICSS